MVNKKLITTLTIILVLIALVIGGVFFATTQEAIQSGLNVDDRYPNPDSNFVYAPVSGFLQCVKAGNDFSRVADGQSSIRLAFDDESVSGSLFDKFSYYRWINCPAEVKTSCQATLSLTSCRDGYTGRYRIDSGAWIDFNNLPIPLNPGDLKRLQYDCRPDDLLLRFTSGSENNPRVDVKFTPTAIQLNDYESYLTSGIIQGTDPFCKFIGANAQVVADLQKENPANDSICRYTSFVSSSGYPRSLQFLKKRSFTFSSSFLYASSIVG